MSRIVGRNPAASGQTITLGYAPDAGWMNAASQVPSGVFTLTSASTTASVAASDGPVAATSPAATERAMNSRRDTSCLSVAIVLPPVGGPIAIMARDSGRRPAAQKRLSAGGSVHAPCREHSHNVAPCGLGPLSHAQGM